MLTKEEETLLVLMGYKLCTQDHKPGDSSWTNAPHWVDKDGGAAYAPEMKVHLYGE